MKTYPTPEETYAEVLRIKEERSKWAVLAADLRAKLENAERKLLDLRPSRLNSHTTASRVYAAHHLAVWRAQHIDKPAPVWAQHPGGDESRFRVASVTEKSVMVYDLDRRTDRPHRYSRATGKRGNTSGWGTLDVPATLAAWEGR